MERKNTAGMLFLLMLSTLLISACGGGTDGIEGTGLRGTVAIGAPITNTKVTIKGINGNKVETQTDSQGKYDVAVDGLVAPYFIKVELSDKKSLFSVATKPGVGNTHPITDLLVRNWLAIHALNISNVFDSDISTINLPATTKLDDLLLTYNDLFAALYEQHNVGQTFNPITTGFDADSTGFDLLLDLINIDISNTTFNVSVIEPITTIQHNLMANINLNLDLTLPDNIPPTRPSDLNVFPVSDNQLILTWNISTDNYSVMAYRIYRDDVLISTLPYPVFTDSGLSDNTQYCYAIEAVDAAENVSTVSGQSCATTSSTPDVTAPDLPSQLQADALDHQRVQLSWVPSQSNDVLAYHINRRSVSTNTSRIASVINSQFIDAGLSENTEYCYSLQAFDAQGNVSQMGNESCVSTLSNAPVDTTAPITFATPGSSEFIGSASVQITCDDGNGSGCAGIFYTLDNSEPTTASERYSAPIELTETAVIKFFGVDVAGNAETNFHAETYTLVSNGNGNNNTARVQFSSTKYSVAETVGAAEIMVLRLGDNSEPASVSYNVLPSSATTPEDYISVSGSLSWDANDSTSKPIYVPIKGDRKVEGMESFTVVLSSPSASVALGDIQNSSVNIENSECDVILSDDIIVDTVLSDKCVFVTSIIDVKDNANLTIQPGTSLVFDASAGFNIRNDGSLTANGTIAKPILMTGFSMTPGYWSGVQFTFSNDIKNSLDYVTIEYAGARQNASASLVAYGSSGSPNRLAIKNSRLVSSSGYGFEFSEGTTLMGFENNLITENESGAGRIDGNVIQYLDSISGYSGNTNDVLELFTTTNLTESQSWPSINVPYLLENLNIRSDLVIAAGNTLIFKDDGHINVRDDGSLTAIGDAENKIVFTSESQTPGAWGGIQFTFSNDNKNILDHVVVEYGGKRQNGEANVIAYGSSGNPQRLKLTNSTLRYSSSYGFEFSEGLTLTEFSNNVVTDNEGYVAKVDINLIPLLDLNSDYSGNVDSFIEVSGNRITSDQSWKKLNVDYLVDNISVDRDWTIEPGVNLMFRNGGFINVRDSGSLNAVGTMESPILFSCEDEFRGAWRGIQFTFTNSGNNQLINSIVEYAGGSGGNGIGSVRLYGSNSLASRAVIQNTTVQTGDSYAIWLDNDSNINSDVDTANTFLDNEFDSVFRN